jgi:hypothetical protein
VFGWRLRGCEADGCAGRGGVVEAALHFVAAPLLDGVAFGCVCDADEVAGAGGAGSPEVPAVLGLDMGAVAGADGADAGFGAAAWPSRVWWPWGAR